MNDVADLESFTVGVDAVDDAVLPASCGVEAGQRGPEPIAESVRIGPERTIDELKDRYRNLFW